MIPMRFLVANNLPFTILVQYDILQSHDAIINMKEMEVYLMWEGSTWTVDITEIKDITKIPTSYYLKEHSQTYNMEAWNIEILTMTKTFDKSQYDFWF